MILYLGLLGAGWVVVVTLSNIYGNDKHTRRSK